MDAAGLIEQANERSELACDVFCQFQKFDTDQSGYLGFRELGQALRALFKGAGLKKTPDFAALEESFGKADADGDNKISQDEFVAWYNHAVEWTRRLQDEAVAEAIEAKKSKQPAMLGQSALSTTSTKVLFDLKMHGHRKEATPRSEAEASSHQELKHMLALDGLPSLSESESRGVRDLFMRAVAEADKAPATGAATLCVRACNPEPWSSPQHLHPGLRHAFSQERQAGPPPVRDAAGQPGAAAASSSPIHTALQPPAPGPQPDVPRPVRRRRG